MVVVPAFGASERTALGFFPGIWPGEWGPAPPANMRGDAACTSLLLRFGVVVAFVQADVFRTAWPARGAEVYRVEGLADHVHVVVVGAGHPDGQRNSLPVYQDVALYAEFSAIARIVSRELLLFGA